jgi:hypothetical protein
MESVLNDTEKRFILAEMIKLSDVDVGVLIHLVKSHDIQPNWLHMQLPGGKWCRDCHVEIPSLVKEYTIPN